MDRRSFLRNLFGAAAVVSTNPVSFFAPIGGWTSDVLINPNSPRLVNSGTLALQMEMIREYLPSLYTRDDALFRAVKQLKEKKDGRVFEEVWP